MKKILSLLLIIMCVTAVFAAKFTPYLETLDLHPAILGGWCPTYIGIGGDTSFAVSNGDIIHADVSFEGGITERALFQNPNDGEYITLGKGDVALMDIITLAMDTNCLYEVSDAWSFTAGYEGRFEKRQDSMLVTGKYWPKGQKTLRWLGGAEKQKAVSINNWLESLDSDIKTTVYPELRNSYSLFNAFYGAVEFDIMEDTMVANNGILGTFKMTYLPGFLNKEANLLSTDLNFVFANKFIDIRFNNGLNAFALSVIDRANINYTFGSMVPTFFQQSISLGRKVRGFDTGSYASTFTAVNNFEVRLSGPEPVDGIFLRTNLFFDVGIGSGRLFNCKESSPTNFLASVGVQEQIDYNDAFDLGIQVAYLLHGQNYKNPTNKVQVGATFFLDF